MTRLLYREFDGFKTALERQFADFSTTHPNATLELSCAGTEGLYDQMFTNDGLKSGATDIFMCCTDWLAEAIENQHILQLDDFIAANPPPNWPDGWHSRLLGIQQDANGSFYGMPYHDGPQVFMYRTDLFDDPKEQLHFERQFKRPLAPPATWDEFLDIARFFTRPDDELYGCVIAGMPDGHNSVYDFCIHLWSRGGELLNDVGQPIFASESGREALQFYLDLIHTHRVTQPDPWEYDSVASGEYYASGRAAMMWNWVGFQTVADLPEFSAIPGRTRSTLLPGGSGPRGKQVSLLVYWVMTIATGARDPQSAWDFLRHLAIPEMDLITAESGGSGVRKSTWSNPRIKQQFAYYDILDDVYKTVRFLPRIPEYPQVNTILNDMMASLVRGNGSIDRALEHASDRVSELLAN